MEMPVDVITRHVNQYDMAGANIDPTDCALDLDQELQRKFLSIPFEELEAVDIKESRDGHGYYAGDGPELCKAGEHENPNWLYNHGINALALWWRIKRDQEAAKALAVAEEAEAEKQRRLLIHRPVPGVYMLNTGGEVHLTVVDADRRIFFGTNRGDGTHDVTDIYDGLENKSRWVFTHIETGLSA